MSGSRSPALDDSFVAVAITERDQRGSILQIAAVNVCDRAVTDSRVWDGPGFDPVAAFEEVREFTGRRFIVAHDGVYVARALADAYFQQGYASPTLAYLCSMLMCRREFPSADYSLEEAASRLGVDLPPGASALKRAQATASLVLELARRWRVTSLDELMSAMNLRPGFMSGEGHTACWTRPYGWPAEHANPSNPLFGQSIVFTGATAIPRTENWEWAREYGATADERITKRTTTLVIGDGFAGDVLPAKGTSTTRKAAAYAAAGQSITVLDEVAFTSLLSRDIVDVGALLGPTWSELPAWVQVLRSRWVEDSSGDVVSRWFEHLECPDCDGGVGTVEGLVDRVVCETCGSEQDSVALASPWGPTTPRGRRGQWVDCSCPVCATPRRVLEPVSAASFLCRPSEVPTDLTSYGGPGPQPRLAFDVVVADGLGPRFSDDQRGEVHCWEEYAAASREGWYRSVPVWVRFCPGCGVLFAARTASQEYCSTKCGPMPVDYARELRRLAVAGGPVIDRLAVFERDRWVCYLCGKKVARNPRNPLEKASVDHMFPIVLGGHHSWENVRTTHLRCNLAKSDSLFTAEQVAALSAYLDQAQETADGPTSAGS